MHEKSASYFVGNVIAKPIWFYSAGAAINTSIQLLFLYIGVLPLEKTSPEETANFLEAAIYIMIPVIPPIGIWDTVNVIINIILGLLIAFSWTLRWSAGMSR